MPDPVKYLQTLLAAAVVSMMIVLLTRVIFRRYVHLLAAVICVLALSAGLATGYGVLQFSWPWPPANALNRFLTIVLPTAVIVELLATIPGRGETARSSLIAPANTFPQAWQLPEAKPFARVLCIIPRLALYASVGRILLHDSVYLDDVGNGNPNAWTFAQSLAMFGGSFVGLIAVWSLLYRLSERSAAGSITISLAMAIQCTGLATMMAGYINGGAAAFPLSAALVATTLASPLLVKGIGVSVESCLQALIGIGMIGLFSLLCIGHYFGQLTGPRAIVLFLTPLICWISELPGLRLRPPSQKLAIRLIAVTTILAGVLLFAKWDFDRKMAPLLSGVTSPDTGLHLGSGVNRKPHGNPTVPLATSFVKRYGRKYKT